MPKIFITGSGGVGKSTIIKRLEQRGFTAYDTDDMPAVSRLEDPGGAPVEWPDGYVDWDKYRWNWQRSEIKKLLSSNETAFLGAIPSNWHDFVDDFDIIIALTVDAATHEKRLRTRSVRTTHKGQTEQNIADNVYSQAKMLEEFVTAGAIVVNNDRPLDEVVDEILTIAHVRK